MEKVLGEAYFIDLDAVEKYLQLEDVLSQDPATSGETETKVNLIKFELVKMFLDVILSEDAEIDENLGIRSSNGVSIPFKLAFNSLLNKKLINYY
jgi:hypothetical protein